MINKTTYKKAYCYHCDKTYEVTDYIVLRRYLCPSCNHYRLYVCENIKKNKLTKGLPDVIFEYCKECDERYRCWTE